MKLFLSLVMRDVRLSLRYGADTMAAVLFFLIVVALFPLAIGPAPETLGRIAPGIIWVSALLSAILPLERLFGAEYEDGSLDQLLVCGLPASVVALAKACAHWLMTGLPLMLAAVPLALMLHLPVFALPILLAGLALGTPILSLLGTAGAAVVLGARRGGVLLPLLVLPLAVPVLVFGVGAVDAIVSGHGGASAARADLLLLAALLAACTPLCPLAAGAGLKGAAE